VVDPNLVFDDETPTGAPAPHGGADGIDGLLRVVAAAEARLGEDKNKFSDDVW